jgi:predicted dinucleotide-binding enzyme
MTEFMVQVWTDFKWSEPKGDVETVVASRTAALLVAVRMMNDKAAQLFSQHTHVRLEESEQPQMVYDVAVFADDEADALKRARYRIKRLLSVKLMPHGGAPERPRTLNPPWGAHKVSVMS